MKLNEELLVKIYTLVNSGKSFIEVGELLGYHRTIIRKEYNNILRSLRKKENGVY